MWQDEPTEQERQAAYEMHLLGNDDLFHDCLSSASDEPLSDPDLEFERGLQNEDLETDPCFGKAGQHMW